ncbi:MAG: ATP-binding protein, partial [Candidatus Woesearchaeota archaeon]
MVTKGIIIGGSNQKVIIRKKSNENIELGELLISENENKKILMQVIELSYASQLSQQNIELITGISLEEKEEINFYDSNLKNYILAIAKPLVIINEKNIIPCKKLPDFLTEVREIYEEDLEFTEKDELYLGNLRSGSKVLNKKVILDGKKVLSHHLLISAQTGKGKSNLLKNIILNSIDIDYGSFLIFDPHDEYYRNGIRDQKVKYYSLDPLPNTNKLSFDISLIKPSHLFDLVQFSGPQKQHMYLYYNHFKNEWVEKILKNIKIDSMEDEINEASLSAVRRRIMSALDISIKNGKIKSNSVFKKGGSKKIFKQIISNLESNHVVIDTSRLTDRIEKLLSMMIARKVFNSKKRNRNENKIISMIIEEAPRVLKEENNIFSTIAREGRKFQVGLIAITQMPSLIPKQVLANLNTKIIMGTEMSSERNALIDSSAQDLTEFSHAISSLNIGEALITTTFTNFAVPIKTKLFEKELKKYKKEKQKSK